MHECPPGQWSKRSYGLTSNEDIVKKLNIPNDVIEALEKIVSSECLMYKSKQDTIRRLTGGSPCRVCKGIPSHEVRYEVQDGGATRIERYCDNCMKKRYRNGVE